MTQNNSHSGTVYIPNAYRKERSSNVSDKEEIRGNAKVQEGIYDECQIIRQQQIQWHSLVSLFS